MSELRGARFTELFGDELAGELAAIASREWDDLQGSSSAIAQLELSRRREASTDDVEPRGDRTWL